MNDETARQVLDGVLELIVDLAEEVNGLFLRQSSALEALAATLPGFAQEYDRIYNTVAVAQAKRDSEGAPSLQQIIQKLKKTRLM